MKSNSFALCYGGTALNGVNTRLLSASANEQSERDRLRGQRFLANIFQHFIAGFHGIGQTTNG